jgi:hypothetical protein
MTDDAGHDRSKADFLAEISAGSLAAMKRARLRAEEIAARTGTVLIQAVDGKPVRVEPPRPRRADSTPAR